jgi:hypothetical protein
VVRPPAGGADMLTASRRRPVAAGFGSPEAGSRGRHGALSGPGGHEFAVMTEPVLHRLSAGVARAGAR